MRKNAYLENCYEDRMKRQGQRLRWLSMHLDPYLVSTILVLNFYGAIILYSAGNQSMHLILRQQLWFAIGFIAMIAVAQIPPGIFKLSAKYIYLGGIGLIVAVLIIGKLGGGAQRWLSLGGVSLQPSEIMKLIVPIAIASYLSEVHLPPSKKSILICLVFILLPFMLVLIEPDLGTAITIGIIGVILLNLAGISKKLYVWGTAIAILSAPLLWHMLHGYQKQRILTFINPERNPLGAGYHIIQSEIAIGSGGWLGKGWMQGTQSHLQFLPTHTTDFIFAVLGEEFGLLGACILLAIYLIIWLRCLYLSFRLQDPFCRLLSTSLSFICITGALINIGMTIGIVPVVGIPLPLISYGGTSVMINLIIFGIIMSAVTHSRAKRTVNTIQ